MGAGLLINIDVPDLDRGVAFYAQAFGLAVTRRLGAEAVELGGWPVPLYLLQKPAGSIGAAAALRRYDRHWTPVHFDVAVDDIEPRSPARSPPARGPKPKSASTRGARSRSWPTRSATASASLSSSAAATTRSRRTGADRLAPHAARPLAPP